MKFDCKKTENCFAKSRTWEYRLPITAGELAPRLAGWTVTENRKYRRPLLSADRQGVNLKGVLDGKIIKVSYPEEDWQAEKAKFEDWLLCEGD